MKYKTFISIALTGVCISAFAASMDNPIHSTTRESPSQSQTIINFSHLTQNDLNEINEGCHPEKVIEFSENTTLPIGFFLKGDLAIFREGEVKLDHLKIKQTFYVRCIQEELFISTNLIDWKPFLEFITGTASVSLTLQDGQASIMIGAEANRRL